VQGKLKEGTGWAEFKLQYDAIVFRPFKGEVLECVVREVNKFGFFAECGPQAVFVSELVRALAPLPLP
jgi:DNA-directed RNA polymerase II subunit RPB7